ncbi:hypothetical protein [Corynebacterium bovis]|uniref:Uncharacterized protein n=1 Tax=Corynebacterium bovis TaxID=36808 RepID=A0A3R8PMC7_9CORY|nr:hypothetical protein [Corynebacterium bovis]RRO91027.1 hypothetical protein CXF40_07535 [Corynebacterium bovis]RRO95705.1 hypothetical protein CXF32_07110 [Corynebacterium bovis]RRO97230.1 hypothetical protein CXF31_06645 [Corynebacterium bovis]RRQ00134.1 hypothetical protein CXF41_07465 [Corynebacterium bovis]RRQ02856.1 hypothetical protein CXF39_05450 [Corynebacterium bovis]
MLSSRVTRLSSALAATALVVGLAAPATAAPAAQQSPAPAKTGGRIYSRPEFPYYTDVYNMRFLADAIMPKAAMAKLTPKQRNELRFGPTSEASAQACYDSWKPYIGPMDGIRQPIAIMQWCNLEEVTVGEYLQTVGAATGAFISTGFESVAGSLGRIAGSL